MEKKLLERILELSGKEKINISVSEDNIYFEIKEKAKLSAEETTSDFLLEYYFEDVEIRLRDGIYLILSDVSTKKEHRNTGHATLLINSFIAWAKKRNYKGIALNASPTDYPKTHDAAQLANFYAKFGFQEILDQGSNIMMLLTI